MGVYIRGMEMPTACFACKMLYEPYWKCRVHGDANHSTECRPTDCPLIEVHEPHGDLIDREELQHIIGQFSLNWEYGQGVSDCWDALLNAPTVIPASEEGET